MKSKYLFPYIFYGMLLVLITGISSCKRYLEVEPKSSFDETYVFGSVTAATSAVMSVYGHLAGEQGYGSRLSLMYTVDQDESLGYSNSAAGGGDNSQKAMARYNTTSENAQLERPYNQLYGGIEGANICIKNIPKMDAYTNGTDTDKKSLQRLYGEVLTLRAQFYFELVRNWGDVPAPFAPSIDQPDLFMPKTDRDTIYEHLLNDLKTAEDLVPWRGEAGVTADERITKGAVKAIRAKIALFRGGYSLRRSSNQMERRPDYLDYYKIVRDECREIITSGKHALNPGFESVFKEYIDAHKIEINGEVLFEVALAGGLAATDSRLADSGPTVGVSANGAIKLVPTYYYAFDSVDTRKDVTGADYTLTTSNFKLPGSTGAFLVLCGKFRRDWVSSPAIALTTPTLYTGINWPVIRYSDVLLMFAEADNELNNGPSAEAIAAYEQVRKRAFKGNESKIGVTPADKNGFSQALMNERWLEFGGEGIRKYDLIRWNLLGQKIAEAKANLNKMMKGEPPYENLPAVRFYKNYSTTMVWYNSMYRPAPATAPANYTVSKWISGISAAFITNMADSYKPNHSELMPLPQAAVTANPNLTQDYGY